MIDPIYYGIGFLIYIGFCMLTFEVYSKKQGETNMFVLYLIYVYYTILAGYVINLVDGQSSSFVRFIEVMIYVIAAGVILTYHYKYVIDENEKKDRSRSVSF